MNASVRTHRRLALASLAVATALAACSTQTTVTSSVEDGKDLAAQRPEKAEPSRRAEIRMQLATGYFAEGRMPAAMDEVQKALEADPGLAAGYNLRALIQANQGDDRAAEESFRRALALAPQDPDALHNYGYFLCQKQRYPEARSSFERALAVPRYADRPRTLLAKGVCEARAGQLAEAEESLSRANEIQPGNPAVSVNLAEVLYRRRDYERARFFIRRVNAQPQFVGAQTLWLAARVERAIGNPGGARDVGEQLRSRFPDSREARLYERGQFDE